jgi:ATP-dependent DNA helicase Q4
MTGLVVVISPLISLMTDQIQKLPTCITGACFNSYQTLAQKKQVIEALSKNKISVLFLSPERLMIEDFSRYNQHVSMVCIDEVHCSSEWSHNFRPSYLKLEDIIFNRLDCPVVLGLTATATKNTEKSLISSYGFKKIVRSNDLSRLNLSLCITRDDEMTKLQSLCSLIKSPEYKECKSIIVYCTYKSTTDILARNLTQQGIESKSYHAGKDDSERQYIQSLFNKNLIRCIVCTIAFSMGIDKKDVNSVIHYDMPQSIESYVQEIGRAGRDGKLAKCHLIISDRNYYSLRQILLTNMIDQDITIKLVAKLMSEIKQVAIEKQVNTYIGRRKFEQIEDDSKFE